MVVPRSRYSTQWPRLVSSQASARYALTRPSSHECSVDGASITIRSRGRCIEPPPELRPGQRTLLVAGGFHPECAGQRVYKSVMILTGRPRLGGNDRKVTSGRHICLRDITSGEASLLLLRASARQACRARAGCG